MPACNRDRVGRYEVLTELGRGAMGTVYKARDPKIDRLVAIKTISVSGSGVEDQRDYRERFFREAQAAGRLSHPGIVAVYDVDEAPDYGPYIVMEYVPGQTLDQLLSAGPGQLPLATALDLADQLAQALHYAHAQGIVHRDIKPANIIVTAEGRAKITDFGVAKLDLSQFTTQGLVLGTPSYMSPEQLEGESVDARSDLFSLGVVLYAMLTGYRPFQGNSAATISFKVVYKEPVPVSALNSALPPDVDYVVGRALAKAPAQRYASGQEFSFDLEDLQSGLPPRSRDGSPVPRPADQTVVQRTDKIAIPAKGRTSPILPGYQAAGKRGSHLAQKLSGLAHALRLSRSPRAKVILTIGLAAIVVLSGWTTYRIGQRSTPTPQAVPSSAGLSASPVPQPSSVPASAPVPEAAIEQYPMAISLHHPFASATLSVWVDDKLTYQRRVHGQSKTHMLVVKSVEGTFSGTMSVPAGEHALRVQVLSDTDHYQRATSLRGDFHKAKRLTLTVDVHGHNHELSVTLDSHGPS